MMQAAHLDEKHSKNTTVTLAKNDDPDQNGWQMVALWDEFRRDGQPMERRNAIVSSLDDPAVAAWIEWQRVNEIDILR